MFSSLTLLPISAKHFNCSRQSTIYSTARVLKLLSFMSKASNTSIYVLSVEGAMVKLPIYAKITSLCLITSITFRIGTRPGALKMSWTSLLSIWSILSMSRLLMPSTYNNLHKLDSLEKNLPVLIGNIICVPKLFDFKIGLLNASYDCRVCFSLTLSYHLWS